ncbi:MAG: fatty acid oxidation complex subunit alpha FadJ [Kangiellaceae bacterium]|jgi:3-hydroxyacyl-CoA dehydrogenase/enoyl-CoA hydratase/3-hydroxybutyryl-CoA epimerase|nr:fatty acid oxidation complex subunit alpha FadJ [Kangiellaceae bacterium]
MGAFTFNKQENGIGVITVDVKGDAQNTLKAEFSDEITEIMNTIESDSDLVGLIIVSGKKGSFIAGADITMIKALDNAEETQRLAKSGQDLFNRLESGKLPVVAAIDGACLGGGLELAMACHQRVATPDSKTRLGLPEVQLGLLPGSGGTQRLPRLVGIANSLDLMLTGKQLNALRAKKMGLVDEVVPVANLMLAAEKRVLAMAKKGKWRKSSEVEKSTWQQSLKKIFSAKGAQELALETNSFGRKIIFDQARKTLKAKTRGNYPAPVKIVECVEMGIEHGFSKGLEVERRYFAELSETPQSQQLINLFFSVTDMKKDTGVDSDVTPQPINRVGVLGGGLMGAGIANVTIEKAKKKVRIKDVSPDGINNALNYSWKLINKKFKRKQYSKLEVSHMQASLTGTTDYSGFAATDLVIEAVFEDLDLKHQMVKDVEQHCKEDVIFATNTSSIPIADIATASSRPERVIGLHYFSPVEKMPLLEIIKTDQTSDQVIATCVEFGKQQGKTVIVVNDGAGFYVNRILAPYMNEAGRLLSEGVAIDKIDKALVDAGFPVGPITLLDEVGIDVATKVAPILTDAFGDRMAAPATFGKLTEDNRKGKKNGRGFYLYNQSGGKSSKKMVDESVYQLLGVQPTKAIADNEIVERCLLLMVNEAVRCFDESIIRNAQEGDIGAIFGIGFPPFLGGPFRYIEQKGINNLVAQLNQLAEQHGARFKPADLLVKYAESGQSFY